MSRGSTMAPTVPVLPPPEADVKPKDNSSSTDAKGTSSDIEKQEQEQEQEQEPQQQEPQSPPCCETAQSRLSAVESRLSAFRSLGFLDRFLALWIFLAMLIGILLGNFVDNAGPALQKGKFVEVSVPIGKPTLTPLRQHMDVLTWSQQLDCLS
jgi:ACR3 family arsenite transporter